MQALNKARIVKKALDWIANQTNLYTMRTQVLGNCVGIMERDNPRLYGLLSEVCQTLDYAPVPRIFSYHSSLFRIGVYAGTPALLVIPDLMIREFDDDMLRFCIGRAITTLKADTCQLKMLANAVLLGSGMVSVPGLNEAMVILIADWCRKAGLTEDRGGLLACQDIYVAEKTLMRMTGMPLKFLDSPRIVDYIEACQEKAMLATVSQYIRTVGRTECWNNDRIVSLYQWYRSGQYHDIMEEHEG